MIFKAAWSGCLLIAILGTAVPVVAGTCTDDIYESEGAGGTDDTCSGAEISGSQVHAHCDEDWVRFKPLPNASYRIESTSLTGAADTLLSLHEDCGVAVAANDDFIGLASRIEWTPVTDEFLDVRITSYKQVYTEGDGYTLSVECINNCAGPDGIHLDSFEDIPQTPDLLVVNSRVSAAVLGISQEFTFSATVLNQGVVPAGASTLRYFLSFDSLISDADIELGTDQVPALGNASESAQDFVMTTPDFDGSYWLGACVDTVAGEVNDANQCSVGVAIVVVYTGTPDLVVTDPGVSAASLTVNQEFTINATASNQGDGIASATTLRYYRSTDNLISMADTPLGTFSLPPLPAAASSARQLEAAAPASPGNYWVGACVDAVSGELVLDNQCSAAAMITVLADSDGDRLADAVETGTGVFIDQNDTGTLPNNADSDGDGIKDGDEVLGTLGGLDLPALGVSPVRKDLLLEYDWFDDSLCGSPHTHRPTAAAIAKVVTAFANSPVSNFGPDDGINIINDYGQDEVFTGGNLINDPDGVIASGVNGDEFKAYKAANFAANRIGYFHYVLLPHRYNTDSGSSGQAEYPGDDLVISLVCYGTTNILANTILHELGHNLFLHHGGDVACNHKPNYNSVMNYRYQFPGVDNTCTPGPDGVTDYSHGGRIPLNETALNEFNGTCGPGFPFDWNGDTVIESLVSHNTNPYSDEVSQCGAELSTLGDFNDWENLYFGGIGDADGLSRYPKQIISEQPVPE